MFLLYNLHLQKVVVGTGKERKSGRKGGGKEGEREERSRKRNEWKRHAVRLWTGFTSLDLYVCRPPHMHVVYEFTIRFSKTPTFTQGRFYVGAGEHVPPDSLVGISCCLQIQELAGKM